MTACDTAEGTAQFQPDQDLVSICEAGMVTIIGLTLEAKLPEGTCDESLFGVLVSGDSTLDAFKTTVDGAGAFPINGCQGGVGIQVGMAWTTPVEVGHATLSEDTVENYQKNGVTVDGAGSTATATRLKTAGAGPTSQLAQNGVQVSNGALATISRSTISGNECEDEVPVVCGPDATQSIGALFLHAAPGSNITKSKITNNDLGVYYASGAATQPGSPEVTISGDTFREDRDEGVLLEQGDAAVNSDKIDGPALVGIELGQFEGQPFAIESSGSGDTISGMSEAAIKVESDNQPGDVPGTFTIENSSISKNAAEVINNSASFTVNKVNDH